MSIFGDIQAALDTRLNSLSGSPSIAWENTSYTPTLGTLYLRPTMLPAESIPATLSTSGTDENTGIYQIDIFAEAGTGYSEIVTMADAIADHFKPVTELTYNSRTVRCIKAFRSSAQTIDGWYQIPVEISYLSFTAKR